MSTLMSTLQYRPATASASPAVRWCADRSAQKPPFALFALPARDIRPVLRFKNRLFPTSALTCDNGAA